MTHEAEQAVVGGLTPRMPGSWNLAGPSPGQHESDRYGIKEFLRSDFGRRFAKSGALERAGMITEVPVHELEN